MAKYIYLCALCYQKIKDAPGLTLMGGDGALEAKKCYLCHRKCYGYQCALKGRNEK